MQHPSGNRPSSNALRQRRHRDNNRSVGMPTERQYDRELRKVVLENMRERGDFVCSPCPVAEWFSDVFGPGIGRVACG